MGRAPCCDNKGLKKGPWTPEEDQKLVDYIHTHGSGNWRTLPKNAGLQRCGKSCRLRWTNYLRPDIKRGKFSFQEEQTIIHLHTLLGNKWSAIACRLPGRTDNEIKNHWNTHIRKRLLRMGIDPVTHNPRLHLLDISSSLLNQTLYNHQFRVPRFLGFESMVNPEILNLATSIFPRPTQPQPESQDPNQNFIEHQIPQHQEQLVETSVMHSCDQEQLHDYDSFMNVGFNDRDGHLPSLLNLDLINQHNYVECYNDNDQSIMGSMFSGEQSPSPFSSSNSTYIGNEDERERYCRNMMEFAFPADFLDASEYL